MYLRHLDLALKNHIKNRKEILVLLGARQVGKTTILQKLFPHSYYVSVDNEIIRRNLNSFDPSVYRQMIPSGKKTVVIDEIHQLKDPGRAAKIFYDQIHGVKLIITGSSSFRIKNKTSESLAGRKVEYHLYPLTFSEYLFQKKITKDIIFLIFHNLKKRKPFPITSVYNFDLEGLIDSVLLYGLYPTMVNQPYDEVYLRNLADSVVFKDLLDLSLIENRQAAKDLLVLLAYQIGSLINVNELSRRLHIETRTVKRYIRLFEMSNIIFTLPPYLGRKRDEISKMKKIYFYDIGLRNAVIDNFQPLRIRNDYGQLFENFIISEILKANYYGDYRYKMYFWRTKQGSEIDLVLEKNKELIGLEIKSSRERSSLSFKKRFPEARVETITKKNFY